MNTEPIWYEGAEIGEIIEKFPQSKLKPSELAEERKRVKLRIKWQIVDFSSLGKARIYPRSDTYAFYTPETIRYHSFN